MVVVPEPLYILLGTPASIAQEVAVSPNKPKGFMTNFNNGNPAFNYGPRSLPKNPSDLIILDI